MPSYAGESADAIAARAALKVEAQKTIVETMQAVIPIYFERLAYYVK